MKPTFHEEDCFANDKPTGTRLPPGEDVEDEESGVEGVSASVGHMHACIHDDAEKTEFGLAQSGARSLEERNGSDGVYSRGGS